jgi:TonB family protein
VLPKPPRPRVKPRLPVVSPDGRDDVDPGRTDGWDSLPKADTALALPVYGIGRVVERMPEPVFLPEPDYPELARMAGIEGRVIVKLLVDVDGAVIDVGLLLGSGNSTLDRAALQAAARARFTPGRQGIQAVRVWVAIPYSFVLG